MADVTKPEERVARGAESREETRTIEPSMTDGVKGASACVPSALLLILRNGSINETAGQTNPVRPRAGIEETIGYLLAKAAAKEEGEREKQERKSGIP